VGAALGVATAHWQANHKSSTLPDLPPWARTRPRDAR